MHGALEAIVSILHSHALHAHEAWRRDDMSHKNPDHRKTKAGEMIPNQVIHSAWIIRQIRSRVYGGLTALADNFGKHR